MKSVKWDVGRDVENDEECDGGGGVDNVTRSGLEHKWLGVSEMMCLPLSFWGRGERCYWLIVWRLRSSGFAQRSPTNVLLMD